MCDNSTGPNYCAVSNTSSRHYDSTSTDPDIRANHDVCRIYALLMDRGAIVEAIVCSRNQNVRPNDCIVANKYPRSLRACPEPRIFANYDPGTELDPLAIRKGCGGAELAVRSNLHLPPGA